MKHGRLAHIRSQFSLFRRSPTHKNLPLATFCTSEQLLFGSFCRSKKNTKTFPFRELSDKQKVCPCRGYSLAGSFEVSQTSNQLTAKAVSHRPLRGFPAAKPLGRSLTGTFCPAFEKAGEMFPKGNGFILFASTKRTKSSPEGCDPLDSEGRFKTLSIIFFRDISNLRP